MLSTAASVSSFSSSSSSSSSSFVAPAKASAVGAFGEVTEVKKTLRELLSQAFSNPHYQHVKGKDIVLVVGVTGSGKSTTVNYLLGCEMKEVVNNTGIPHVVVKDSRKEFAKIGHSIEAETLYPGAFSSVDSPFTYTDCPGFEDNRGENYIHCAAITTKMAIQSANSIRGIMVVIEKPALLGRASDFMSVAKTLDALFSNGDEARTISPDDLTKSLVFIVTKIQQTIGHTPALLERLKKQADASGSPEFKPISFVCGLMQKSGFLEMDPMSEASRGVILSKISTASPIHKGHFGFPAKASTESKLNVMLKDTAFLGSRLINDITLRLPADIKQSEENQLVAEQQARDIAERIAVLSSQTAAPIDRTALDRIRLEKGYLSKVLYGEGVAPEINAIKIKYEEHVERYGEDYKKKVEDSGFSDSDSDTDDEKDAVREARYLDARYKERQFYLDLMSAHYKQIGDRLRKVNEEYDKVAADIKRAESDALVAEQTQQSIMALLKSQKVDAEARARECAAQIAAAQRALEKAQSDFLSHIDAFEITAKVAPAIELRDDGTIRDFLAQYEVIKRSPPTALATTLPAAVARFSFPTTPPPAENRPSLSSFSSSSSSGGIPSASYSSPSSGNPPAKTVSPTPGVALTLTAPPSTYNSLSSTTSGSISPASITVNVYTSTVAASPTTDVKIPHDTPVAMLTSSTAHIASQLPRPLGTFVDSGPYSSTISSSSSPASSSSIPQALFSSSSSSSSPAKRQAMHTGDLITTAGDGSIPVTAAVQLEAKARVGTMEEKVGRDQVKDNVGGDKIISTNCCNCTIL